MDGRKRGKGTSDTLFTGVNSGREEERKRGKGTSDTLVTGGNSGREEERKEYTSAFGMREGKKRSRVLYKRKIVSRFCFEIAQTLCCCPFCMWVHHRVHCKKNDSHFPVPNQESLTKISLGEYLSYSRPGKVWLVTSRLGTEKPLTFLYSVLTLPPLSAAKAGRNNLNE